MYIPPPLQPHEVCWFYQEPGKFWQAFGGYDSLRLERSHLDLMGWGLEGLQLSSEPGEDEEGQIRGQVTVMGDLYVVLVEQRLMEPVYWPGESWL